MLHVPFKFALLCVTMVLGLAACGEDPRSPMRVGTNVWPGYEPAYLARDLGYFSSDDITLNQFQSATETIRAFRNSAIDVVALTLDEALLLAQDGIDVQIFLVADVSDGGDVIVAQPGIDDVQDLKGRTIGVESSALGAYVLTRALEIHGVPIDEVQLSHLTVDESEQAFYDVEVDAVVTFEPYRSRMMNNGATEIFTSREMPNEIVDVLVTRRSYLEENPEALSNFTKAWLKAVTYIEANPEKAAAMIGARLGLSVEDAQASFVGLWLPGHEDNITMLAHGSPVSLHDSAAKLSNVLLENGLLKSPVSMDGVFTDAFVR